MSVSRSNNAEILDCNLRGSSDSTLTRMDGLEENSDRVCISLLEPPPAFYSSGFEELCEHVRDAAQHLFDLSPLFRGEGARNSGTHPLTLTRHLHLFNPENPSAHQFRGEKRTG